MTNEFEQELSRRLAAIREEGLYRELRRVDSAQSRQIRIGGREFLNFSSNDYLGLANEPVLKEAAKAAVEKYGAGAGASRLVCGSLAPYHELEETLAAFKGTEAALTFSTGYATAVGTITALLTQDDIIVLDKLVHACIVDAARLCGAKLRVFAHNDLRDLAEILQWADSRRGKAGEQGKRPQVLIVTESVFSMDGDFAPLRELVTLKEQYGAWLMLDEAHATGLYGANRRGLAEAEHVAGRIEIQMGTMGKALGASGGYICGSRALVELLVNRARSIIFSTAPVPAAAAAAKAGIEFVQSAEGPSRCAALWERVRQLKAGLSQHAAAKDQSPEFLSAIIPLILGSSEKALAMAGALRERGLFVPAIRYPTVARDQARLRITLSAKHTGEEVELLLRGLEECGKVEHP